MANTTTNTLAAATPTAERALFGFPDWTVVHTITASTLAATVTGVTGKQHCLTHVTLSFSAAPAGALVLTVKDGTTVIWQVDISTDIRVFTENFETRPLRASAGADLVIGCATAGGSTVQTISAAGFSILKP